MRGVERRATVALRLTAAAAACYLGGLRLPLAIF